jgi:hypothetical protein
MVEAPRAGWSAHTGLAHHHRSLAGPLPSPAPTTPDPIKSVNKSQQMRWTRRGADLLLQVRCAVYNGTFGSAFGQRFSPANDTHPTLAAAA